MSLKASHHVRSAKSRWRNQRYRERYVKEKILRHTPRIRPLSRTAQQLDVRSLPNTQGRLAGYPIAERQAATFHSLFQIFDN